MENSIVNIVCRNKAPVINIAPCDQVQYTRGPLEAESEPDTVKGEIYQERWRKSTYPEYSICERETEHSVMCHAP